MFSGLPVCFFAYLRVAISVLLPSGAIAEIPVPEESGNSSDLPYLRIDSTQLNLVPRTVAASRGEGRTPPLVPMCKRLPPRINPAARIGPGAVMAIADGKPCPRTSMQAGTPGWGSQMTGCFVGHYPVRVHPPLPACPADCRSCIVTAALQGDSSECKTNEILWQAGDTVVD